MRPSLSRSRLIATGLTLGVALIVAIAYCAESWDIRSTTTFGSVRVPIARAPKTAHAVIRPVAYAGNTRLPLRAGTFVPFTCDDAFEGLTFFDPLAICSLPDGGGRMVVVERRGTVQIVERIGSAWAKKPLVDLTDRVHLTRDLAEEGLLGLAFHPQFADRRSPHCGELFVYYTTVSSDWGIGNRVSRLRATGERLDVVNRDTETILIEQPDVEQAHNGGCLVFGPDGFLYISVGDDASADPNLHSQVIDNAFFSGVLRIDVDCRGGAVSHPPPRQPRTGRASGYFIPTDNPFVGMPGALEEFYALGFRNPWRMSFDRVTRQLYVSDVGSRFREEINVVHAGSNCGWAVYEGTLRRDETSDEAPRVAAALGAETPPLFEYSRDAAHRCVIGGYVYRGRAIPELRGRYVYADQSGRIYALDLADRGQRVVAQRRLAVMPGVGIGISSFGEDADGELYLCTIGDLATETGRVFRLRRVEPEEEDVVPEKLFATEVFAKSTIPQPAAGLAPFDVSMPFWSDGADKRRWIALPSGKQVNVAADGSLVFPPGTVFVKHFDFVTDRRSPEKSRPLETRVLVCDDRGGSYGATYRWPAGGGEPQLVSFQESETLNVIQADGSFAAQTWVYPGRHQCAMCHNDASGHVLGFTLKQLNHAKPCPTGSDDNSVAQANSVAPAPANVENQIDALVQRGVLAAEVGERPRDSIPRLYHLDDQSASLEDRVRSYLDVNCSACHNPKTRFAAFDARLERSIGEQGLVWGAAYHHGDLGRDVKIVRPGNLAMSMLHLRLAASDPQTRMPPIGSTVVDRQAQRVLEEWIKSLPVPEVATAPAESATK